MLSLHVLWSVSLAAPCWYARNRKNYGGCGTSALSALSRDAVQATAGAHVAERLGLKFNQKELSALPLQLVSQWKELVRGVA
jgi:hypothetical protein